MVIGKLLLLFILIVMHHAHANVRLPNIISSNMVLQQNSSVKLWGWAEPGENVLVTTSWSNNVDSAKGDAHAKWQVIIQTPKAGGPYTITIKGNNTITLQNVLIGEVWVCSGQSNMEMNYNWGIPQMKEDISRAANPNIRFFHLPRKAANTPQEHSEGSWVQCDSNTVKSFSAVAYYFGKKLNADLNIPIGLVHASWGGTPAEVWMPAEVVESNSVLIEAAKKLNPSRWWPVAPGYAYNAMIAPLTNYKIAGVIWYQGESNTGTAATYHQLFTAMIEAWRQKWRMEFPFYFVQLAPYAYGNRNIAALLREAQAKTLSLKKTGMVVTTDLADDTTDIHPKNKKDVGLRLANLALADTYGKRVRGAKSPLYKHLTVEKNKISLSFHHVENGFAINKKASGFFIAGTDKIFQPAEAKISGNRIVVWSNAVPQPVAVRYAFSNTAVGNVFSKDGLPLAPFRTDDWEVDTSPVK